MLVAKRLKELLKDIPDDARIFAYEGEDTGINIVHPDGHWLWIRATPDDEVDDYQQGFTL